MKVVTVMRWYVQDEVNQEDSEQNEVDGVKKGADSTQVRWCIYLNDSEMSPLVAGVTIYTNTHARSDTHICMYTRSPGSKEQQIAFAIPHILARNYHDIF